MTNLPITGDNWSSSKKVLAPKLEIVIRLLSQDPAEGFKIIHLKAGLQDWTPLIAIERAENECGRRLASWASSNPQITLIANAPAAAAASRARPLRAGSARSAQERIADAL